MTIAYWCVLAAALLPYVWIGYAKFGGPGGYDNRAPRAFVEGLEGARQRGYWAQLNAFEAFPPFAAGVVIAHQLGVDQGWIDGLAGIFLLSRILHGVFYVADRQILRSAVWTVGFSCVIGLFVISM